MPPYLFKSSNKKVKPRQRTITELISS